jgi:hypothetical protein
MNKFAIILTFALTGCVGRNENDNWLNEVQNEFKYKGKMIPPLVVKDFCCWLSDSRPQIGAINLETAIGSNRYFGAIERSGEWISTYSINENKVYEFVKYKVEKCDNGKVYLIVSENGGGSSTFQWELIVHGEKWPPLNGDSESRYMLILDGHK